MKLYTYFILILTCIFVFAMCSELTGQIGMNTHFKMNKKHRSNDVSLKTLTADDLADAPLYYQGWIKYFNYDKQTSDSKSTMPKFFFKNEEFAKQGNLTEEKKNEKDIFGLLHIPNESSFWGVVYPDRLNIVSKRGDSAFLSTVDSLSFDLIHSIPDDAHNLGGIKDKLKFAEGYCFEVNIREPTESNFHLTEEHPIPEKGTDKVWIICSDSEETKEKFMNVLIKLRLKKQHKAGLWLKKFDDKKKPVLSNLFAKPEKNDIGKVSSVFDGYWVLLQDWSTCTLKCGGGLQYQHLMCVPPKKGGKPCEGEAVRTKPCNVDPCPTVTEADEKILPKKANEVFGKPIVKVMPISSRPLRYDKCHIKESDAVFTKYLPNLGFNKNINKIPSRVVMNEKTVSIYTDETLITELATFVIEKTTFKLSSGKANCFVLDSQAIKGEFCNLDANSKGNFVDEWNYDFNLFKNQCHQDRKVVALNIKEEKELQNELNNRIQSAKLDIVKERTKRLQHKAEEQPLNKMEKLQETAMLAMKKELSIDQLLQKEELEREEAEQLELQKQVEIEKKKEDCLIKSIKEKELEDQFNLSKAQHDKELNELKEQAKQQILMKRKQVKLKILQMRKRAERKKKILQGEMQSIRSQVASKMSHLGKEGNLELCFKPSQKQEEKDKVMQYCKTNFMESSPSKFNECLDHNTFCYVCCETEFGNMHLKKRDECYDKCDSEPKKDTSNGSWQWVETIN